MLSFTTSAPAMADINVYSEDGQLVVAIDILGTYSTPTYLEQMRAALLRRSARANPLYLMLVQPCGLYLWHADAKPHTEPQFASLEPIVQCMTPSFVARGWTLSGEALLGTFSTWLNLLAFRLKEPNLDSAPERLLVESGVYKQMLNGIAELNVES